MEESTQTTSIQKPRRVSHKKRWLLVGLIVLVIILAGALGYTVWQNQRLRSPEYQAQQQDEVNKKVIENVAKIFLVPSDTEPTIASIVDIDSLRKANPEFYRDAQNGDRLLIYATRAIIYRESENKVINVAPVSISETDSGLSSDKKENTDNKPNQPASE